MLKQNLFLKIQIFSWSQQSLFTTACPLIWCSQPASVCTQLLVWSYYDAGSSGVKCRPTKAKWRLGGTVKHNTGLKPEMQKGGKDKGRKRRKNREMYKGNWGGQGQAQKDVYFFRLRKMGRTERGVKMETRGTTAGTTRNRAHIYMPWQSEKVCEKMSGRMLQEVVGLKRKKLVAQAAVLCR